MTILGDSEEYDLLKEMVTKSKTGTKKDLEVKIAELEAKLTKLGF